MSEPLQISYSLANIESVLHQLWQYTHQYAVLAFSGQMGAGKTTLISHLCKYLQVEDAVSSPTFALINEYHFNNNGKDQIIYHMDWYRLNSAEELINAGIEDCLQQKNNYSLIEWPEKAPELLPKPYVWISIESVGEEQRVLTAEIIK